MSNQPNGRKPNILFILTDDQGYGDLACHGNPIIQTPNLDKLHAESVRFIEHHQHEPFLCFITTNAPHSPFIVADDFSDPYVDHVEDQNRANFYGMITCIDAHVGLLRQQLEALGLAENTILIFMTDNGTAAGATPNREGFIQSGYNAGMRGIKGSPYEGGHRVPFFLHWPAGGLNQGKDIAQLTANIDVMPTLLDLCGIEANGRFFDGISLKPLLLETAVSWPDRTLITDSQRVTTPIKWRQSATMTQKWRVINGVELYDIQADPEQRHNVTTQHPDVVTQLRTDYEAWWEQVSQQFDGTIPIPISTHKTTLLTAHDWRNKDSHCPWNQSLIRAGMKANGYWEIDVAQAGTYRFELRRWPREANLPLVVGITGKLIPFNAIEHGYGGGRALSIKTAAIQVADISLKQNVDPEDEFSAFVATLQAGETTLQTYFVDLFEQIFGAYYVYVTLVSAE